MKPKIAYLIDENAGWDDEPSWVWYAENDAPAWKIERANRNAVRRIVYWEIEDE